jgi:hypothetical protein
VATMDRLPYGSRRLVAAPAWLPSRQTAMPLLMFGAFTAFLVLLGLTALTLVQHRTGLGSTELAQPTTVTGASTEAEAAGPPSISSLSTDGMQAPGSVGERVVPDLGDVVHGSDAGLVSTNNLAPPAAPAVLDQPEAPVLPQAPATDLIGPATLPPSEPQPQSAAPAPPAPLAPAPQRDSASSAVRSASQTTSAPPAPPASASQTEAGRRRPADPPRPYQAKGHPDAAPGQAKGHDEHDKGKGANKGKR